MLAIGATYIDPVSSASHTFVMLQGGPYVIATSDPTTGEVDYEFESAMSDGTSGVEADRAQTRFARQLGSWGSQGLSREGQVVQVELPSQLRVDRPEEVVRMFAERAAQPIGSFRTIKAATDTYQAQMSQPAPDQARARSRRRVAVDERDEALTLADPDEALIRPNGQRYLPRYLYNHTDAAALRNARENSMWVLLRGEPGSGKTALADSTFPDLIDVSCDGDTTAATLFGTWKSTPNGAWEWVDGPVTTAVREGRALLLDEIDRLPYELFSALHSLLDGRGTLRLGDNPTEPVLHAAPGFYVVATANPNSRDSRPLPQPILSRFPIKINVGTDYDAAGQLGVPRRFVTFAKNLAEKNRKSLEDGGPGVWAPQMRELLDAKRCIDAGFGEDMAIGCLIESCPVPEDVDLLRQEAKSLFGTTVLPVELGEQVITVGSEG